MGVVYLALSERTGGFRKLKVVKRLRPDLADDARALAMFQEEARLSASLSHPNIVQTNEVGFDGRYHFLEMEYLDGASFHALLKRTEPSGGLPLPLAILVLVRALAGLAHAHTARDIGGKSLAIVHRDVSPHNVFITADGNVKLLDFGIAKAADSASDTETGVLKGKVAYMSPEQAMRRVVDTRTDIFAIGVMLFQCAAKQRLWGDIGDFEIYMQLREGKVPRLADAAPTAPPELVAICDRALEVDPDKRWASAAEMQAALEAYLTTLPDPPDERALAATMREHFAQDFERRQADIEEQARTTEAGARSDVLVPRVDDVPREATTGGSATLSTASRTVIGRRRVTRIGLLAIAVAALAVTVATVRAVRRTPSPAASSSAATVAPLCASAAECGKKLGKAAVCRPQGCVALETAECKLLAEPGDAENDRTIWIGAMMPLSGPRAAMSGTMSMRAVELARRDFAQIAHGIPRIHGDAPPRPFAVISCDDDRDHARVAKHLVEQVGVAVVLGFGSSQEVIDLSTATFLPHRVFVAASLNMGALITSIPHPPGEPRLVWRTIASSKDIAVPTGRVLADLLEPRVRTATKLGASAPIRVALVRHPGAAGLSFADALVNNASLVAHPWPGNVRELKNTVERALTLCEGPELLTQHVLLDHDVAHLVHDEGAFPAVAPTDAPPPPGPAKRALTSPEGVSSAAREGRLLRMDPETERALIVKALEEAAGNQSRASRMLGISRRTLVNRLAEFGLRRPLKRDGDKE